MPEPASSPVVGVVALVGLTVILAASVAVLVGGVAMPDDPPEARFTGEFDPDLRELTVRHAGGDPVASEAITLRIQVDGKPLAHQPPVPFFAATGFGSGPTGPFNPAGDDTWAAGDEGTLRIATTNDPVPTADSTVRVTIVVDGDVIGVAELAAA